jgi:hypothetical protein
VGIVHAQFKNLSRRIRRQAGQHDWPVFDCSTTDRSRSGARRRQAVSVAEGGTSRQWLDLGPLDEVVVGLVQVVMGGRPRPCASSVARPASNP